MLYNGLFTVNRCHSEKSDRVFANTQPTEASLAIASLIYLPPLHVGGHVTFLDVLRSSNQLLVVSTRMTHLIFIIAPTVTGKEVAARLVSVGLGDLFAKTHYRVV